MTDFIDVVVLTRDEQPINQEVLEAIQSQAGVSVVLHRVIGTPRDLDANRWATIARARNVGRAMGSTPWLMFVDDDVVLGHGCIRQLLEELKVNSAVGALAADYLQERDIRGVAHHVAMGATLFRRESLIRVEFRCEENRCECQCMADDLRRHFIGIDYSALATAEHLDGIVIDSNRHSTSEPDTKDLARPPNDKITDADVALIESETCNGIQSDAVSPSIGTTEEADRDGEILVAFDRAHSGLFRAQFVPALRASGNQHAIHAVAYGLRDKQIANLRRMDGVKVYAQPYTAHRVCRERMLGFQYVLQGLCPQTPIAYWDAGDVIFQTSLEPLWNSVRQHVDKLLVVEEPLSFENNPGHQSWIQSITNKAARQRTFALLAGKPVVNGGFIAGLAARLLEYLRAAYDLVNGDLLGAGGGDQVVLNVCRYEQPSEFEVIDDTWNYCLVGRSGQDCKVERGTYVDVLRGRAVSVVHGNAGTLVG